MEALPGFLIAALALAGSPGPATLSLAAAGAAFGARRGLAYLAGLTAGMVVVMGIVASGVVGLLLAVPGAAPVVTARGSALLRLAGLAHRDRAAFVGEGTGAVRRRHSSRGCCSP